MAATDEIPAIESVLLRPAYCSINTLFGRIICQRLSAKTHACTLLRLLREDNGRVLRLWEEPCSLYLQAVNSVPDAIRKIMQELSGPAKHYRAANLTRGFSISSQKLPL
jgi:hypothetical protein